MSSGFISPAIEQTPCGNIMTTFTEQVIPIVTQDSPGSNTITVFRGHEILWSHSSGWANVERHIPATTESVYRMASITKPVTAAALLCVVDDGRIALDDPVEHVLPEIRKVSGYADYAPITYRQLASHSSGLAKDADLPGNASGLLEDWQAKALACIPTTQRVQAPGHHARYSNIGYVYLGLALERATGQPFLDLVQEKVLNPLGMMRSGFGVTDSMKTQLAEGYVVRSDGSIDAETPAREHAGRGCKVPPGGLYSTARDLVRFLSVFTGDSPVVLLSERSRAEMLNSQVPIEDPREISDFHGESDAHWAYTCGFRMKRGAGSTPVYIGSGNIPGYAARAVFHPTTKLGVLFFRNFQERQGEVLISVCLTLLHDLVAAQETT